MYPQANRSQAHQCSTGSGYGLRAHVEPSIESDAADDQSGADRIDWSEYLAEKNDREIDSHQRRQSGDHRRRLRTDPGQPGVHEE